MSEFRFLESFVAAGTRVDRYIHDEKKYVQFQWYENGIGVGSRCKIADRATMKRDLIARLRGIKRQRRVKQ